MNLKLTVLCTITPATAFAYRIGDSDKNDYINDLCVKYLTQLWKQMSESQVEKMLIFHAIYATSTYATHPFTHYCQLDNKISG